MSISPNIPKNSSGTFLKMFQKMGTQNGTGERSVIFFFFNLVEKTGLGFSTFKLGYLEHP